MGGFLKRSPSFPERSLPLFGVPITFGSQKFRPPLAVNFTGNLALNQGDFFKRSSLFRRKPPKFLVGDTLYTRRGGSKFIFKTLFEPQAAFV